LDGRIVPLLRCSLTNLRSCSSSACDNGISLPGSAAGAPGLRSIAWSQGREGGNSCDASSEKTLSNCLYCGGIGSVGFVARMSSRPICIVRIGLGVLVVLSVKRAHPASGVRNIMGNCEWSIQPLFQSIFGCMAANQGYPSMALFSPKFERKNRRLTHLSPVCTARSV
jgi:hypothetical protein